MEICARLLQISFFGCNPERKREREKEEEDISLSELKLFRVRAEIEREREHVHVSLSLFMLITRYFLRLHCWHFLHFASYNWLPILYMCVGDKFFPSPWGTSTVRIYLSSAVAWRETAANLTPSGSWTPGSTRFLHTPRLAPSLMQQCIPSDFVVRWHFATLQVRPGSIEDAGLALRGSKTTSSFENWIEYRWSYYLLLSTYVCCIYSLENFVVHGKSLY